MFMFLYQDFSAAQRFGWMNHSFYPLGFLGPRFPGRYIARKSKVRRTTIGVKIVRILLGRCETVSG
jgi:hypothetical protein